MERANLAPTQLIPTFQHHKQSMHRQKTWSWLESMALQGRYSQVPPVIAVQDPETAELWVYNGNIRTAHAREHGYELETIILTDQKDLDKLLENQEAWLGIKDFPTLIRYMKMYAEYLGK